MGMKSSLNDLNKTQLVDDYIGTAYEIVKNVHESLELIETVNTNIADIQSAATFAAQIDANVAATTADRTQTGLDVAQTTADRAAVDADKITVSGYAATVASQASQVAADLVQTDADQQQVAADKTIVNADKLLVAADRVAVESERTLAETARTGAETARSGAETAEGNASASESLASLWAEQTYGLDVNGIGTRSAKHHSTDAETAKTAAQAAQAAAETAQGLAETARTGAEAADTDAQIAKTAAEAAQTAAAGSAASANTDANTATTQAGIATTQAGTATTKASEASASAAAALISEGNASGSASAASSSESAASGSESAASSSASSASVSATLAADWAEKANDTDVTLPGTRSAKHWANVAQVAATGALHYMGAWSAAGGTYPVAPALGDFYRISVAGTLPGGAVSLNDSIIYNGASWDHLDNTDAITSVDGRVGAVTLSDLYAALGHNHNADYLGITATAAAATKLATTRNIALTGDVTGNVNFDGTANVSITAVVTDDSHNHIISNVDGLQTALDTKLASASYTAADVLAKLLTVDGSGSGLDADTLDGVDSGQLLRSDTADYKTAGALVFNDNVSLQFGSDGDSAFFHNGTDAYFDLAITTGAFYIRDQSTTRFTFDRTTGAFTATGDITANSDERLKDNITVIENPLGIVDQLGGYTYQRNDLEGMTQSGVLAQEVQKVLPHAVKVDAEGTLSVAYNQLIPVLLESIKELQYRIEVLENGG